MLNSTSTKGSNILGSLAANATKAANAAANTAIKAANVVSDAAVESTSTLAQNVTKAANSAANAFSFNSLLPLGSNKKNNSGANTAAANATTPSNANANANKKNNSGANAGNMFQNVNAANLGNAAANAASELPGWAWPVGIFILLVGIFVMAFVFFKSEIQLAYDNLVSTIRKTFGYSTETPEYKIPGEDVTAPLPGPSDEAAKSAMSQKSIVEKVLPLGSKEVFNVSDNNYTFYDAEPLCRALGAELASYDQVKEAWEKGADWCNYGWVKGQVAVYPTQKETWDKLQHGPEDEKFACGDPGVNGGFFDNPEMKFGVNCYGVKPSQSSNDEKVLMEKGSIPKTPATLKVDQQIQEYKANMDQVGVLPFSTDKWSA